MKKLTKPLIYSLESEFRVHFGKEKEKKKIKVKIMVCYIVHALKVSETKFENRCYQLSRTKKYN